MDKPTQEQIKEFWERCELNYIDGSYCLNGELAFGRFDAVDLNNLFKYAVPFLLAGDRYSVKIYTHKANNEVTILAHYAEDKGSYSGNPDLALALFWAIWQAKKEVEDG